MTVLPRSAIACRRLSLAEVRRLEPIRSGYKTERVFRLERHSDHRGISWQLRAVRLPTPYRKLYDSGRLDEWLESYEETARPEELSFAVALVGGEVAGLVTWRTLKWNNTLWLVDIRTQERLRRSGIGSALLGYVKNMATQERVRGISVETQINNYPAVCFYQKHGFEVAGFNDHLYTNRDVETQDVAVFLFWEKK